MSTKECLSAEEVLAGLLDHGLFSEKVPPCFTTVGLETIVLETMAALLKEADENRLRTRIKKCAHDYIRYESLRDINIPRQMGIPHPHAYAAQALAISKHWQEIATHCNQPSPAVSRIYVQHVGTGRIFEMNYKGNDRFRHEESDLQWMAGAQFLVEADISRCFQSIYSHSIPWALHGQNKSKETGDLTALTGNVLDLCTTIVRDKQTNGVVIGPHSSNIISEIVLTSIDAQLQGKGYKKLLRHIDDYRYFANSHDDAEAFIRDLGLCLRTYECSLNERKTRIVPLPRPSDEDWVLALNRFQFPNDGEVKWSVVRSYLDLALECAQKSGKSTPLNYAIKTLASCTDYDSDRGCTTTAPRKLNTRAKKLYAQEAMNLALSYPYLVPLLEHQVFDLYWHDELKPKIAEFATLLVKLGIRKLYPDSIAHGLYFALKYGATLELLDRELVEVVAFDDCISNVLLLEYGMFREREKLVRAVRKRARSLKGGVRRELDRQWLLLYQVWTENDLKGNGQEFLAMLKAKDFKFFLMPVHKLEQPAAEDAGAGQMTPTSEVG